MAVIAFLIVQSLATALAAAFLWRRHNHLRAEVETLRETIKSLQTSAALVSRSRKRAEPGVIAELPLTVAAATEAPLDRARRLWRAPTTAANANGPNFAALRGAILAVAGAAPAFGLFFGAGADIVVASALFIASALLLTSLRSEWGLAGPIALAFATVWCGLALGLGLGGLVVAAPLALLGFSGLACERLTFNWLGAAAFVVAAVATLVLTWQDGFFSAPGLAFALLVVSAAIVGASSLRLDALLIGAFVLSLLGLFAMSGQDMAAIWFTPVVAVHGALFLAIAAIRVPQLGARGTLIAGIAALSALGSAIALNLSQHGLANNIAAAGVFTAIAAAFAGIVVAAATRRDRGHEALKLTLWILAGATLIALACAIAAAMPALIAAPAAALMALAAIALNGRYPAAALRACVLAALMLTLAHAYNAAHAMLSESPHWPPLAQLALGVALPGAIAAAVAFMANKSKAGFTAAAAEATALVLAVAAASLGLRLACSGGALLLTPISFGEAGAHAALWLAAALACAARSHHGAGAMRLIAAHVLAATALAGMGVAGALWVSDYWTIRAPESLGPLSYTPLGFFLPALAAGAHWIFWRARDGELQARIAFGAGTFMAAGFATLAALGVTSLPETTRALICALVIAAAIALNFAPGVVASAAAAKPLRRRRRRRQLPQQA